MLVVDHRELLSSTARVVGAQLGELHFKAWMALITLHVAHGLPDDGAGQSNVAEFSRLIWGEKERGGSNTRKLLRALFELEGSRFTVPGWNTALQQPGDGASATRLLIDLYVDETILRSYAGGEGLDRAEIGRRLGGKSGTIAWKLHPTYTQRLADSDLRRFDWTKAQQLRGVALALWMLFSSPRVPYRAELNSSTDEVVEVALTVEHCQALGVRAGTDAARRRTLNEAGPRVCAADKSFKAFEAHGGRGRQSFLRVVRHRSDGPPMARPYAELQEQLSFEAA